MKKAPSGMTRLLPLLVAASLVACAGGAPANAPQAPVAAVASAAPAAPAAAPTGTRPAAAPPAAVAASITKSLTRVARPIPDPAAGKSFKASQYWDYELGTPFEIEDTTITGLGDADKDGRTETKIVSDVKLPNQKMQAKLLRLGKYALTQADDEEAEDDDTSAEDDGDGVDPDDDAGDADADTDASGTDVSGEDDDDATTGSDDDGQADAGDDEDFDFDDWETEIDAAEVDEEIGEDEDDITWEDDWTIDGDGDGLWEDGEDVAAYEEDFSEEEEDAFLTAPHRCEMVVHDAPAMGNEDDKVTVTDLDTGETLTITFDQDWIHFAIASSAGRGTIEYLPDGTYLVDGQAAADEGEVAERLERTPWFRVTSRYALGLVAARLGRLAPGTRCERGAVYRITAGDVQSDERRSFAIVNALVSAADEE